MKPDNPYTPPRLVITGEQLTAIRMGRAAGVSCKNIGLKIGIARSTVGRVAREHGYNGLPRAVPAAPPRPAHAWTDERAAAGGHRALPAFHPIALAVLAAVGVRIEPP